MVCTFVSPSIHRKMSLRLSGFGLHLSAVAVLASLAVVLLSGCGIGTLSTTSSPVPVTQEGMHGRVHGGNQPVQGALIQLWAADPNDYPGGSSSVAPVQLLTSTVTTDGSGSFNITGDYVNGCNDNNDPQVYITATGGNPGLADGTNNGALVLMAALGDCDTLQANAASIFVDINEVSTVASVYALAQFAAPNPNGSGIVVGATPFNYSLSANPTGQAGLAQAMKTVSNLEDLGTGTALSITPYYKAQGGTSGGLLNSSYVPQARINTLANILAACVNTAGATTGSVDGDGAPSQCNALFAAAKSGTGPTPTDTLQAVLSIAQHPANNVATLWGISPPDAPFQPSLSSAPMDWTLALTYTGGGLGANPVDGDPGYGTTVGGMAIDAKGNIWMLGNSMCTDPNAGTYKNAVVEFDNQGNALSPNLTAANSYCGGGYQPTFNGVSSLNSDPSYPLPMGGIAVDLNGFVWVGATDPNGHQLTKLSPDGTVQQANYLICPQYPCQGSTTTLAIDGSNNLWTGTASSIGTGVLYENSVTDGSAISQQTMDGASFLQPITAISLDPFSGSLWAVAGLGSPVASNLYQFSEGNPPTVTNDFSGSGQTFGGSVVADGAGNVFALTPTPGTINAVLSGQSTVSSFPYPLQPSGSGVSLLAIDGAGHLWGAASGVPTTTTDATATIPSYLVEMDSTGTVLSPSGTNIYGYTGTGGGGETQAILSTYGLNNYSGIAVDGSGNVWVANASNPYTSFSPNAVAGEQLVEFIGLAAPTVTPMAQALALGEVGVRPQTVRQLRK